MDRSKLDSNYFLISNKKEYDYVKNKFKNTKFIFVNCTKFEISNSDGNYFFYDFIASNYEHHHLDSLNSLSHNWYRDKNGYDVFYSNGFSIAPNIGKKCESHLWDDYRNYLALKNCIDEYVSKISLDDNNKLKCEKCNDYVNSNKKNVFWDLSPILMILLKKYNENGILINNIEYPTILDMNNYCLNYQEKSTKYELSGIIIHTGNLNSGHYYSICKNSLENKWKIYNDTNVIDIDEKYIFNKNPYFLFYKRV